MRFLLLLLAFISTNAFSAKVGVCAKSANYTITNLDYCGVVLVTTGSSTITITMPAASNNVGRVISIKKVDSGSGKITITRAGADNLDDYTSTDLTRQYATIQFAADLTTWHSLSVTGEFAIATTGGTGTSFGNGTVENVHSKSVSSGEWDCRGMLFFSLGGTVAGLDRVGVCISTSNSSCGALNASYRQERETNGTSGNWYYPSGTARFKFTTTSTVYLLGTITHSAGTISGSSTDNIIECTRVR